MAIAGKVMPRPRGQYEDGELYDVLDLVTLNNKLWIAKRSNIVNIEPSPINSDYWMLAVDGTTDVNQLSSEINNKITEINSNISGITERVTTTEGLINSLDTKIDNVEQQVGILESTKADKSTVTNVTVLAADWTGDAAPYTNTISVAGVTADNIVEVLTPSSITDEQIEALTGAEANKITQDVDSLTLYAYGDIPVIDIPLTVVIRGDV